MRKSGNTEEEITLNYPVVLVHGIVAHDLKNNINCWGRIPETLRSRGVEIFFGNTDAWGDYETNALILKATIEKILSETKKEKVNIIAHSKGGLDSRYLIWKHDFGDKIASLTTIATPHHGSEIADVIYDSRIIHTKTIQRALVLYGELCSDLHPNLYEVNYQLTTMYMKEFNENITMDDRVYCQSFYATMINAFDDRRYYHTYLHIKETGGDNDGLVSVYSASWGDNITKIEGGISHSEVIDIRKRRIPGVNIPDIYIDIVRDLGNMGF
jgi:triacylglycerol lipase